MKGPKRTYNEVFLPFSRFWNIGFLLKLHSHTDGDWIMERVKSAENFETRMWINHYEREWNPHPWALLGMLCFSGSCMCKTLDLDDPAKCPCCLRGEENITHWGYPGRKTTLVGIPLLYGIKKTEWNQEPLHHAQPSSKGKAKLGDNHKKSVSIENC